MSQVTNVHVNSGTR